MIRFVSFLLKVGDSLWVLQLPTNKTDHRDMTEILMKVALNKQTKGYEKDKS